MDINQRERAAAQNLQALFLYRQKRQKPFKYGQFLVIFYILCYNRNKGNYVNMNHRTHNRKRVFYGINRESKGNPERVQEEMEQGKQGQGKGSPGALLDKKGPCSRKGRTAGGIIL